MALTACTGEDEMDIMGKHEMLYTAVLITAKGSGSGVVVYSGNGYSLILTAQHVISDSKDGEVYAALYPQEEEHPAKVVKTSNDYDLAIVRIEHEHDHVAKRMSGELSVFTPVWKIGSGLGQDPFPTEGMISAYDEFTMTVTSPIIFGDSGGGIFIEIDGEYYLVGTVTSVAVARLGPFPNVVPHMANAYNMFAIEDFFKAEK